MLQCPSCDTPLEQDFGMVTCLECKAVLMIDMSGQVQVGSDSPLGEENTDVQDFEGTLTDQENLFEASAIVALPEDELDSNQDFEFSEVSQVASAELESFSEEEEELHFESIEEHDDLIENEEVEAYEPNFEAEEMEHSFEEEELLDDAQNLQPHDEPDTTPVDVTAFANSESSSLEGGELLYDLTISRLDSKDLREEFKYVLMDEKLKLNFHEYVNNIKNGSVKILNLNPIKTKRVVEQLQYLDLDIRWEQKRVVMEDVVSQEEVMDEQEAEDDLVI